MKVDKKAYEAILEHKTSCEANIAAIIYKDSSKMYENKLKTQDFSANIWRVYFVIAQDILIKEQKPVLDEYSIGFYLDKHPNLKKVYDNNGGYDTILNAGDYIKTDNFDGYVDELHKWNAVLELVEQGFRLDEDILKDYRDMSAEDIYNEFSLLLNDAFINVDHKAKEYDIAHGIDDLIEELDEGWAIGLPYYQLPLLTKKTGGQYLGAITLVGGLSNVGKSTFARNATLQSIMDNDERIVIMLNEEGLKKWQREFLVFVINNVFKIDIQKHTVRDGNFKDETKKILQEAADWIKEKASNGMITIIPFQQYRTSQMIKTIKKHASLGVKYFMLDTFKLDAGKVSDKAWLEMQQSMVEINDTIKPEANNLHILITFQLAKGSIKQRYYTQENIGGAKNIIDPASTCIMIRDMYADEFAGGHRHLKVYNFEGKNKDKKVEKVLDPDKHYQILFIVKNREGSANTYQIVIEHDMAKNTLKEVGVTNVMPDF